MTVKPVPVPVKCCGKTIQGARLPGGRIMLAIELVCEVLGIDHSRQMRKLRAEPWSGVVIMTIPDASGHLQKTYVIPLGSLPMWLATLDEGEVAPDAREGLVAFQAECCEVLAGIPLPKWLQSIVSDAVVDAHDASGLPQEIAIIPLSSVPMWMVTIDPRKVASEMREGLVAFQSQARERLASILLPE